MTIIILVLRFIDKTSSDIGRGIAWPLRIIPSYCFGEGLINMGSVNLISLNEKERGEEPYEVFDIEIALAPIIFLIIFTVIYTTLVFVFESLQNNESFRRYFSKETNI